MNHNSVNDNGVPRRIEEPPPPFPPTLPCIVAIGIVWLIFMGAILTLFTVAAVFIFAGYLCCFGGGSDTGDELDFDIEIGDDGDYSQINHENENQKPMDDQRVVEILEGFFRIVKRRERKKKKNETWKKVVGSIECFGSEGVRELGYSECSICLEEFEDGENCLVFPVCSHVFHCKCIVRWVEKKLTCPVCRYCVVSKATSMLADLG